MATPNKKVLIILYYWPPAGGPGVQRWLKFVTYLPQFGIQPIVYCPKNPNYPIIDESLLKQIPKSVTVLKHPINEPYKFAKLFSKQQSKSMSSGIIPEANKQNFISKLLLFIRGNFFIPDARKSWVKPSVKFLKPVIASHNISTIITTGPPHSLHLIGLQLKQQLLVKWIADFRDPWTTIGYHKALKLTAYAAKKHKALEAKVLNTADELIVTSNHTKAEFSTITAQPITVITNGYDTVNTTTTKKDTAFSLAHIGSLLANRNPEHLWQVISELITEHKDFAAHFQLNLVGVVSNAILESLNTYNLSNYVNNIGYVTHSEAVNFQKKSQLLLLIEINSEATKAIIPGKLFEYMVSKTPILAVGPKDSDVEAIINTTETGHYFLYEDKAQIKQFLLEAFTKFKTSTLKTQPKGLEAYSRKALTQKLADVLR